jgi:two-component system cell cycle response regulator
VNSKTSLTVPRVVKTDALKYKANLLVVDDHPDNLRTLAAILSKHGYKVRKAISGEIALETIQAELPDLILLDIKMPIVDGYTVCSTLLQNDQTRHIPIIFLSALDTAADKVKAFTMGGVDYITKPFQAEEVLIRVEHQLTILRQRLQLKQHNQLLKQEIQERKQTEANLQLLLKAINLVSQANNSHDALNFVLHEVCQVIGWDYGEVWVQNAESQRLELSTACYDERDQLLCEFHQASLKYSFTTDAGLLGRTLLQQEPEWIEDVFQVDTGVFVRVKLAQAVGLKTGLAVPITFGQKLLVVMCFFKRSLVPHNPQLVEMVNAVALGISGFIGRKQTEEALQQANKELLRLAHVDGLTQIANRRCFDETLQQEWARLRREQLPLTLLLCDIDYFKRYNDCYGHLIGDECLRRVAAALAQICKRPADMVARYGGEEFVILLPNTQLEGGVHVAQKIQQQIVQLAIPHLCSLSSDRVTLSIGVASMIPQGNNSPADIITAADQALYQAKAQGRNTYCIYCF